MYSMSIWVDWACTYALFYRYFQCLWCPLYLHLRDIWDVSSWLAYVPLSLNSYDYSSFIGLTFIIFTTTYRSSTVKSAAGNYLFNKFMAVVTYHLLWRVFSMCPCPQNTLLCLSSTLKLGVLEYVQNVLVLLITFSGLRRVILWFCVHHPRITSEGNKKRNHSLSPTTHSELLSTIHFISLHWLDILFNASCLVLFMRSRSFHWIDGMFSATISLSLKNSSIFGTYVPVGSGGI